MIDKQSPTATIKHFANIGDIISSLPACKKFHELTGKKVIFCQVINQRAAYYAGAVHPTLSETGEMVCVNQKMFDMIKPLIETQPYIHSFVRYQGQEINIDFDRIRSEVFVNLPHGMIQSWIFYAFPDLATDLSQPWVTLPEESHPVQEQTKGKIILNFTERYRNWNIDYFFLREHQDKLIFAGTDNEYKMFCETWLLDIPKLEVNDFLEYAYAIKASRFFFGNQSFGWNLANGMGVPRLLEVCNYAANCMPFVGDKSYGFYHKIGATHYIERLLKETA